MSERERLLDQAEAAEANGDSAVLREVLQQLVDRFPDDRLGRLWLGGLYLESGEHDQAFRQLDIARAISPDDTNVIGLWSAAARGVGKTGLAVKELRRVAATTRSAPLLVFLADALHEVGRGDESVATLRSALEIEPDNEEALYNLAIAIRRQSPGEAIELLSRALDVDPDYPEAYRELGFCLMRVGRWEDAETALVNARLHAPRDLWTSLYKAVLSLRFKRLQEAESELRSLLSGQQLAIVHRLLGDVLSLQGKAESAHEQYVIAAKLNPYERRNLEQVVRAEGNSDSYWKELLDAMEADDALLKEIASDLDGD